MQRCLQTRHRGPRAKSHWQTRQSHYFVFFWFSMIKTSLENVHPDALHTLARMPEHRAAAHPFPLFPRPLLVDNRTVPLQVAQRLKTKIKERLVLMKNRPRLSVVGVVGALAAYFQPKHYVCPLNARWHQICPIANGAIHHKINQTTTTMMSFVRHKINNQSTTTLMSLVQSENTH